MLSPHDCTVTLVTFVPLLTEFRPEEPSLDERMGSYPPGGRRLRTVGEQPVETALLSLLDDLELWTYSETLDAQLRERLPRRMLRISPQYADLPPPELTSGAWHDGVALLDLWNFGVGLATFIDRIAVTEKATWEQLRIGITSVETKRAFLARAAQLVAAVGDTSGAPVIVTGDADGPQTGTPLWVQEMLLVEAGRSVNLEALDDVARRLTADGERLRPATDPGGASLRLGIEACVVSNPEAVELRDALGRVVGTQSAVWAKMIELDRELGTRLEQEAGRLLSLQDLEDRSMQLLAVFERVQRFRSEIEIIPLHLAARDKAVWTCVNEEWPLGAQLSSLDTKLNAVEHLYTHRANTLTELRARVLNDVVLAITMLSLATFWVTAWEFVQKRFDPFNWVSALVVLVAVVSSGLLFYAVWTLGNRTPLPRVFWRSAFWRSAR